MLDQRFGGLRPWEMPKFKHHEVQRIFDYADELQRAQEEASRRRRR